MRPIKFRAWDRDKRKMAHVAVISMDKQSCEPQIITCAYQVTMDQVYGSGGDEPCDVEVINRPAASLELLQFTGLLDKNGKEIYEGDILLSRSPTDEGEDLEWIPVIWDEKDACFRFPCSDGNYLFTDFPIEYGCSMEIVGNVFENPDLLPGKE